MNKHKEKCEHLKEIRKNMADALGVDLNQTECTYEGECKGTCPKCQQEEQKLSRALLKGTAVAASTAIMLAGCTAPIEPNATAGILPSNYEYIDELEGDVEYIPEKME